VIFAAVTYLGQWWAQPRRIQAPVGNEIGFFDRNPALNVPAAAPAHCCED